MGVGRYTFVDPIDSYKTVVAKIKKTDFENVRTKTQKNGDPGGGTMFWIIQGMIDTFKAG